MPVHLVLSMPCILPDSGYLDGELNVQPIIDALIPLLLLIGTITAVIMVILYLLMGMTFGVAGLITMGISLIIGAMVVSFLSDGPNGEEDTSWLFGMSVLNLKTELRNRYDPDPDPWEWFFAIAAFIIGVLAWLVAPGDVGAWTGFTFGAMTLILLAVLSGHEEYRGQMAIILLLLAALGGLGAWFGFISVSTVAKTLGIIGLGFAAAALFYISIKAIGFL